MEDLKIIQQQISEKKLAWEIAESTYYAALQKWSLAKKGIQSSDGQVLNFAEIEILQKEKTSLYQKLQEQINFIYKDSSLQQIIEQLPGNIPFLMMPLRIEARYLTTRHVIRNVSPKDTVDLSNMPRVSTRIQNLGFEPDEQGNMTYQIQSYHLIPKVPSRFDEINREQLLPSSGKFIKRMNDKNELWIRIYPDEFFNNSFEKFLQPAEWDEGIRFWNKICSGDNIKETWTQFALTINPARAAWIVKSTRPVNFTTYDQLPSKPEFPLKEKIKDGAYTLPPFTRLLPDQFVVRLYKNNHVKEFTGKSIPEKLLLGLDPTMDPFDKEESSGMQEEGQGIRTPDYLKWIHNLEEAENIGMAIRIDLREHPEFKEGVDKIIVLGAKLSVNEQEGSRLLNDQLENHIYKENGAAILEKGTPTNNFGKKFSVDQLRQRQADLYFSSEIINNVIPAMETDVSRLWFALGSGQHLKFPSGNCMDISEAVLFNKMLWPATLGYYLLQFFTPETDELLRKRTRDFFTRYVNGRGNIPVVRVNQQPYGILPVTSFKHWHYAEVLQEEDEKIAEQLWTKILVHGLNLWKGLASKIPSIGSLNGEMTEDQFFNILKSNPSSSTVFKNWTAGTKLQEMLLATQRHLSSRLTLYSDPAFKSESILKEFTAIGFSNPEMYNSLMGAYQTENELVRRSFIDDLPSSEERLLENISGKSLNYLQWLHISSYYDIWDNNFAAVPDSQEIDNATEQNSILNLLSRQAVLRTYLESSLKVVEANPGLWLLKVKDFEVQNIHTNKLVLQQGDLDKSNYLFKAFAPIILKHQLSFPVELEVDRKKYFEKPYTETGTQMLKEWIEANKNSNQVPDVKEILQAVGYFSNKSTANLERLLGEHLDICSHRIDAWLSALVAQRLNKQRKVNPSGIYNGAFGYLLNLKPGKSANIIVKQVEPEYMPAAPENIDASAVPVIHLAAAIQHKIDPAGSDWKRSFFYIGDNVSPRIRLSAESDLIEPDVLVNISNSDGFIHAPSAAHATTAAILRAGFLNKNDDEQSSLYAVQLNSPRVRQALQMLEGMQQNIGIGELLGYYFERLLHDNKADSVLFDMRRAFPVQRLETEKESPSVRTTVDGLKLLKRWKRNPTTWLNNIPGITPADHNKINKIAKILDDHLDSLGDLLLSESIYEFAKGNRDRAVAALRIMNNGGQVIMPEFIRTPMKGRAITHRVGLIFNQQTENAEWKGWTAKGTPRSLACPGFNLWLIKQLPDPALICIPVHTSQQSIEKIFLKELNIEPIDLLFLMTESLQNVNGHIFGLIIQLAAQTKYNLDFPDEASHLQINYKDRSLLVGNEITLWELSALLETFRKVFVNSRSISPNDFILPDKPKISAHKTDTTALNNLLNNFIGDNGVLGKYVEELRLNTNEFKNELGQFREDGQLKQLLSKVINSYLNVMQFSLIDKGSEGLVYWNIESLKRFVVRAELSANELNEKIVRAREIFAGYPVDQIDEQLRVLNECFLELFGQTAKIFPGMTLSNRTEVIDCLNGQSSIDNTSSDIIDDWIREASLVRKHLAAYRQGIVLSDVLSGNFSDPKQVVFQFPFYKGQVQSWIGGIMPSKKPDTGSSEPQEQASLSMVLHVQNDINADMPVSGIIVDEWPEWIPEKMIDTAVAFQYNQPNSEPPQSMLLVVNPVEESNWKWEYLAGAVEEALDLAKIRLVTPDLINNNAALNQLLPAIVIPYMNKNNQTPVTEEL